AAHDELTLLRQTLAHCGVVTEATVARPASNARKLAEQALERGARYLVAVGSDQIVHALVEAIAATTTPGDFEVVLGLVGLGRQDLAGTFGLPTDVQQAAAHLLGDKVTAIDLGRVRWQGEDRLPRTAVFTTCAELGYPATLASRLQGTR